MHVEPLEKLPRSVREFLSHYAMIVLSILTALALEQALLGLEHRHEGRRAREEIEQEIAYNRRAVEEAMAITQDTTRIWNDLLVRTVADIRAGRSTNESRLATIATAGEHFRDAVPPLKTAAWEAALSDHAVDYLSHEDVTRYSELYTTQRFFSQALWDTVRDNAAHGLSDVSLPVQLGTADAASTVATLNTRVRVLRILASQLSQVHDVLQGTPGASETVSPAPAAASSR
jgi:hypothetical protein